MLKARPRSGRSVLKGARRSRCAVLKVPAGDVLTSWRPRGASVLRSFLSFGLGQIVKGMHELGGWIYAVDVYISSDVEEDVGVVEDDANTRIDHELGDLLGCGRGGGDDADDLLRLVYALFELVYVLDDDVTNGAPDLRRIVVEDVVYHKAPLGQDRACRDSTPQVPSADQRDVVGLPQTQNVPNRLDAVVGLVAHPTRAGEAYGVEVPAHLHGVYACEVAELLARDRVTALLDELLRGPEILGEPIREAGL